MVPEYSKANEVHTIFIAHELLTVFLSFVPLLYFFPEKSLNDVMCAQHSRFAPPFKHFKISVISFINGLLCLVCLESFGISLSPLVLASGFPTKLASLKFPSQSAPQAKNIEILQEFRRQLHYRA